jgi:predicted nuclease with TOPRIM domain
MLGKLFGVEEVKVELQEARDEIQVLEHKLQIKEKSIKQLEYAVRILEENIKSLLDENEQLKARPDHFGRTSRSSDEHMKLLKMYQCSQLSYQEIADKMTEYTGEKWSESTVHYLLTKS